MTETQIALRYVHDCAAQSQSLSDVPVYLEPVPTNTEMPFIAALVTSANVIEGLGGHYFMTHVNLSLRVVDRAVNADNTAKLAQELHDAINSQQSARYDDGVVLGCRRTEALDFTVIEGGEVYRLIGGMYTFYVRRE